MSVLTKISVGDIMYYQVDDIPTHTSPKGSVAIISSGSTWPYTNTFTYLNNDGGTTWLKVISPSNGEISLTNATNVVDFDTLTPGSWYAYNAVPTGSNWVLNPNSSVGWVLTTQNTGRDDLQYTGSTPIRSVISQTATIRGGASKYMSFESGVSENFTVPSIGSINESFCGNASSTITLQSNSIKEVLTNDYYLGGLSPISRESGGGAATRSFLAKHMQINTIKVDEAYKIPTTTLFSENWESSGFTENGWTVVNDASNNVWVVGQAEQTGGTSSAYITTFASSGASATYASNGTDFNTSHFYKDITFPNATTITLTFNWKCFGNNAAGAINWDYGTVNIVSTATTVTAGPSTSNSDVSGDEVSITLAPVDGNGRIGGDATYGKFNNGYIAAASTTWQTETINLSAYAGQIKRLVFTWHNSTLNDFPPGMIIDNIVIIYSGGVYL